MNTQDPTIPTDRELRQRDAIMKLRRSGLVTLACVLLPLAAGFGIGHLDSEAHRVFSLTTGTQRLQTVGAVWLAFAVLFFFLFRWYLSVMGRKSWVGSAVLALVLSLFVGIMGGAAVDVLNVKLADTSTVRTRQVQVVKLTDYDEEDDENGSTHVYLVSVRTLDDGRKYTSKSSGKPQPYFRKLKKEAVYNATVADGRFGFPFIVDFGNPVSE